MPCAIKRWTWWKQSLHQPTFLIKIANSNSRNKKKSMQSKTLFVQMLGLLMALQGAHANGFTMINAMTNWPKISRSVCWFMVRPSLLCTQLSTMEQEISEQFIEGQDSDFNQAVDSVQQPARLGLRHWSCNYSCGGDWFGVFAGLKPRSCQYNTTISFPFWLNTGTFRAPRWLNERISRLQYKAQN